MQCWSFNTTWTVALALAVVLVAPRQGHATVGEPIEIEVLGFGDEKLYYVECSYECSDGCTLHYVPVRQGEPLRDVVARSWRALSCEEWGERMARLRRRLRSVAKVPARDVALVAKVRGRAVREPGEKGSFQGGTYFDVGVELSWDGMAVTENVETFSVPRVRLVGAWQIPGRRAVLAIIRYMGLDFEGGYDVDKAIIIGAETLDAPAPRPPPPSKAPGPQRLADGGDAPARSRSDDAAGESKVGRQPAAREEASRRGCSCAAADDTAPGPFWGVLALLAILVRSFARR